MVCSVIIVASSLHGEHINTYYIMRSLWRSLYICYVLFAGDAHHQHHNHNHNHTSYTKYMCARQYLTSVCVCVCDVCVYVWLSPSWPNQRIFHVCTHHTKVTISSDHQLKRISKLPNGKYFTIGLAYKLTEGVEVH